MSMIDPVQYAQMFAVLEVEPFQVRYQGQVSLFESQISAYNSLTSTLKSFESAVSKLNNPTNSIIKNKVDIGDESYFTATASGKAIPSDYDVFVKQIASRHQLVATAGTGVEGDTVLPSSGEITFSVGTGAESESWTIDLSDFNAGGNQTLSDLVSYINSDPKDVDGNSLNPGVKASLVRSDGQVSLMVTGEETGAKNVIETSAVGGDWLGDMFTPEADGGSQVLMSQARDAIVVLGTPDSGLGTEGLEVTSSTNTFSNIFEGVELTVSKAMADGEQPVNLSVKQDMSSTRSDINSFVDSYNEMMTDLAYFTRLATQDEERGPLASDPTVKAIANDMKTLMRGGFGGLSAMEVGLSFDRDGKLTLDEERFNAAMESDPDAVNEFFLGEGGMTETFSASLKEYTQSSGVLDSKKESAEMSKRSYNDKLDDLDARYERVYQRYLAEFTQLNSVINQMSQLQTLFY